MVQLVEVEVKSFTFWQVVERIQLLFVMVVIMLQILKLQKEKVEDVQPQHKPAFSLHMIPPKTEEE